MKILVISRASWRNDNNTGNTLTNIFSSFFDSSIYSLSFREQIPDNGIAIANYSITEQQLVNNLFHHSSIGKLSQLGKSSMHSIVQEKRIYDFAKRNKSTMLMFARELLWNFCNWKNSSIIEYIKYVDPDIIFFPVFNCFYPHKVLQFIKKYTHANVILFHADDNYSLKQFSPSPLFWIYRFNLRKWIRRSVDIASTNFCISDVQAQEFRKYFNRQCSVLYKSADFNGDIPQMMPRKGTLKLIFTGNIDQGRWETLLLIGKSIDTINRLSKKANLFIYTATPMTRKMKNGLLSCPSIIMMGFAPAEEMRSIQLSADLLVHVESFRLKSKLEVRLSFSTKLVDYFLRGRCIFAVGPSDVASIDYLVKNDAAVVATCKEDIIKKLTQLIDNDDYLYDYARKSWDCGARNHQKALIQSRLYSTMTALIDEVSRLKRVYP